MTTIEDFSTASRIAELSPLSTARRIAVKGAPRDVQNVNTVQDAFSRLHEAIRSADATGLYNDADTAPKPVILAIANCWAWIDHARESA